MPAESPGKVVGRLKSSAPEKGSTMLGSIVKEVRREALDTANQISKDSGTKASRIIKKQRKALGV